MQYLVVIDSASPWGQLLLELQGKHGGASNVFKTGDITHPLIVCSAVDWDSARPFVRLVHLWNPPDSSPSREVFVPHTCIVLISANPNLQTGPHTGATLSGDDQQTVKH